MSASPNQSGVVYPETPDEIHPFIGERVIELNGYVNWLQSNHSGITTVINDVSTLSASELEVKLRGLEACQDFSEKGRGNQWASTVDQHLEVRKKGVSTLLGPIVAASQNGRADPTQPFFLLDVFGGAGFIAQFAQRVFGFQGTVITSDPSVLMVRLTLKKQFPALWQRAQDLFMTRDDSVDAVLFAYGTHHIPVEERLQSFREAWRVLRPGGVLVAHDFSEHSPTARWFAEVVDPYTFTGHKHAHFTAEGMATYYREAGFVAPAVMEIDDPFEFSAASREAALIETIEFMGSAYGLKKLERSVEGTQFLWGKIQEIFPLDETVGGGPAGETHQIVVHRPALLGVGRKPNR